MNITKFVFKTHKWLAVATGAMTMLWFVSGIFMVIPDRLLRAVAPEEKPVAVREDVYRNLRVSIPEAIRAVENAKARPVEVKDAGFRRIEGKLHYRLTTNEGIFLVNGEDASLTEVTAETARRIAIHGGARAGELEPATRVERLGAEYAWGPLPVWRIAANDVGKTIYYVEAHGGEMRSTSRSGRIVAFLIGMHTLEFLNPWLSKGTTRLAMWVLSIVGTAMTLFGFWILWIQWRNWRQARP